MPTPSENKKLAYVNVLENWNCSGYIIFAERALEWVRVHLGIEFGDRELKKLMYEYVKDGGEIDLRGKEQRPTKDWKLAKGEGKSGDYFDFRFDLRIPIAGKTIYFETRLDDPTGDPDDAAIWVVNIHEK